MSREELLSVVVTGAGSGIGAATALMLLRKGFQVAMVDMDEPTLQAKANTIAQEIGHLPITAVADVADPESIQEAIDSVASQLGSVNGVVANAGINGVLAPFDSIQPDEWARTIDVNLHGTFFTLRSAVPHLRKAGRGSIVVVSSINGTRCFNLPGATAYIASKAGQAAFAKALAVELAVERIRVNVVCPGSVSTNISVSGTLTRDIESIWTVRSIQHQGTAKLRSAETLSLPAHADRIAEAILFLLGPNAAHITGSTLVVDGAESLMGGDLCLAY